MALRKVTEEGVTYFEVYIGCPICTSRGVFTNQSHITHKNCGGTMFLGDNAFYKCIKCGEKSHVKNWNYYYDCSTHLNDQGENSPRELGLKGEKEDSIPDATLHKTLTIAIAGAIVNDAGVAWLQEFLKNLDEW